MKQHIIGIDYSMSCPAVCVHPAEDVWNPGSCRFFFLIGTKKYQDIFSHRSGATFIGRPVSVQKETVERGMENAKTLIGQFDIENSHVGLEGYAYGAKGSRVFDIGEHTGILKSLLLEGTENLVLETIPPSMAKKHATTKGNANKEAMVDSMIKHSGIDLYEVFETEILKAPVNDIADAYWMCNHIWYKYFSKAITK